MQVRPKKTTPRKGAVESVPAQAFSFPAPVRGLVLNENIANVGGAAARILDNWICNTNSVRARGGTFEHVTLGGAVKTLFTYQSGGAQTFFGATEFTIFDITATATPVSAVTGQTGGQYSTEQFGTAGGDYLYAVNGEDDAQLFDGATWVAVDGASTPAITGVTTSDLIDVWSFANRLFFIEKGTLNAWYLPVDSIGGAASQFSLAGVFKRGGSLLFGATWSLDAGDGLDDKCVFVSTEGEVAVYEGTNPGDANNWRKAGVYRLPKPLGYKSYMQAGGDLLLAVESGLVPISQAIQRDEAALEVAAVSKNITPLWQAQVQLTGANNWQIVKWPRENIMIISQPNDPDHTCLVANLKTGSWSRFTGLDTQCLGFFDDSAFFGDATGKVYRLESGGSDDGSNYTCTYIGLHEGMGTTGLEKTVTQVRAIFQHATPIAPLVTAQIDYEVEPRQAPSALPDLGTSAAWDISNWDEAVWDGGGRLQTRAIWSSVGRTGYSVAPEVQLTFGAVGKPKVELVSIDATYHVGALVT